MDNHYRRPAPPQGQARPARTSQGRISPPIQTTRQPGQAYSNRPGAPYDLSLFAPGRQPRQRDPSRTTVIRQARPAPPADPPAYTGSDILLDSLTSTFDLPSAPAEPAGYTPAYGPAGPPAPQVSAPGASTRQAGPAPRARRKTQDRRALLEKRLSLILAGVLALCFLSAAVLLALLPRPTESAIEKRQLATFPAFSLQSYFSGEFTAGIATFYDDTVPNRDGFKHMGNNFKSIFGIAAANEDGFVEISGNIKKVNQQGSQTGPDTPAGPSAAQPTPPENGNAPQPTPDGAGAAGQVGAGVNVSLEGAAGRHMADPTPVPANMPPAEDVDSSNGITIIKQGGHYRGLELFAGGVGDTYAQGLNELHRQLGDSVQIYSMPAPLSSQFYIPDSQREYSADQSKCFDDTHALLDAGIHAINLCPILAQHAGEDIYSRTDHHWQPLGAYYAAQALASAAGVPFDDLSAYTPGTIENFVGTLYAFSQSSYLLNDPETFTYYIPSAPYSAVYYNGDFGFEWDDDDLFAQGVTGQAGDAYLYYLGGDQYVVRADTQVQNGRKLLVVKDSYGNATVPFYTNSFQQVIVLDARYFNRNLVSFIRDMGITDVVFTMSSFSVVGENAGYIGSMITQNAGETITDPYTGPTS